MNSVFIFLFASFDVFAACNYNVSFSNINANATTSDQLLSRSISLVRQNPSTPDSKCKKYAHYMSTGFAGSYSRRAYNSFGEYVDYNIYRDSLKTSLMKNYPTATSSERISGNANSTNTVYANTFYFYLPAIGTTTMARSGYYTDNVNVNTYSDSTSTPDFELSTPLGISVYVPKEVKLSLVDSGGGFDPNDTAQTLDFLDMTDNEMLSFDLRVATNAGYEVRFSSLNNGKLKHQTTSDVVDYVLRINGSAKNLAGSSSSPLLVASRSGSTAVAGDLFQVSVQLSSVANKMAGNYADYITITTITKD